MRLLFFALVIANCLSAPIATPVEAQVVHRNAIDTFYGVVEVTATSKPGGWPEDKPLQPTLTSDHFTTYYTGVARDASQDIYQRHRPANHDTLHEAVVTVAPWGGDASILDIPEWDLAITSLHDGGFEVSWHVLAFWRAEGDTLRFLALHRKPFKQEIGSVRLGQQYVIDADSSVYFVLEAGGGDAGFIDKNDTLVRLDADLRLHELLRWSYGIDIDREDQTHATYSLVKKKDGPALQVVEQHFKWFYDPEKEYVVTDSLFVRADTMLFDVRAMSDLP